MIRAIYRFCNRNWWQIHTLAILVILALMLALMAGCGATSTRDTSTVEREDLVVGSLIVDSPFGRFVMHPAKVTRFRTEDTRENVEKAYNYPEISAIGGAALGGLAGPLAGGGFVGLIASGALWLMQRKNTAEKTDLRGQRDELIDGAERAKVRLKMIVDDRGTSAWEHAKAALEAEQSKSTKAAVKARTA